MNKQITIRVNQPTGEFIKIWNTAKFVGFTKKINGGLGPCIIELGEKFDYSGNDLKLNNEIQVLITDKDTKNADENPKLIYSGYISNYQMKSKKEGIIVYLLGHHTKLDLDIWQESATKVTTFDYNVNTDFGQMFRDLMDDYINETVNPKMSYTPGTLKLTGTVGQYMFEMKTYREAIDKINSMAPDGWFWCVDELGLVYFKQKPTTPTHTFVLGKHFSKVRVERSMEKIRNALLLWNGEIGVNQIYKLYENAGSINQYGRRLEKYFDWKVGDEATADKIASKFLNEVKEPAVKVICEIADNNEDPVNGYDIESINPGDTCAFKGFDESLADIFRENMMITKVVYSLNKVELTVEVQKAGVIDWLEKTSKKAEESYSNGSPANYTV